MTTSQVQIATAATTNPSIRLPNSIAPCIPSSPCGTYDESVHCGQVGQPSPDPVSRTRPPVTTMPMLTATEAQPQRRTVSRLGSGTSRQKPLTGSVGWVGASVVTGTL